MSDSDQHIKTAEAAESVRVVVEGESLLDLMREAAKTIDSGPALPTSPGILYGGFKEIC